MRRKKVFSKKNIIAIITIMKTTMDILITDIITIMTMIIILI